MVMMTTTATTTTIIIITIIETADTHVNKKENVHFYLYPLQFAYINI